MSEFDVTTEFQQPCENPIDKRAWSDIWPPVVFGALVAFILCGGILLFLLLDRRSNKTQEAKIAQATANGTIGQEDLIYTSKGSFVCYRIIFEGHTYLKSGLTTPMIHAESCPCKTRAEKP
jgi:hypothetical protein